MKRTTAPVPSVEDEQVAKLVSGVPMQDQVKVDGMTIWLVQLCNGGSVSSFMETEVECKKSTPRAELVDWNGDAELAWRDQISTVLLEDRDVVGEVQGFPKIVHEGETDTRGLVAANVHEGETDTRDLAAAKVHEGETDTRGLVAMKGDGTDACTSYGLSTHEGEINTETHGLIATDYALEGEFNTGSHGFDATERIEGESDHRGLHLESKHEGEINTGTHGLIAMDNALEGEINTGTHSLDATDVMEGESAHRCLHKNEEGESDYRDLNGRKEDCIQGRPMTNRYGRLFIETELDKLEQGVYGDAREEPEGYDKELEERLYPLDEVELQRRIKANADARRAPSMEELSVTLGIPVTTLEKTKDVSRGELSTPEYWTEWYSQTLAKSGEAKRANRDFKGVLDEKVEMKEGSTVVTTSNVDGVNVPERSELEKDVMRNVCAGLTEEKSRKSMEIVSPGIGWYDTIPFRWRSVVRQLLYGDLKKGIQGCAPHDRVSWICTKDVEKRIRALLLEETQGMSKIRVSCLMNWLRDYYYNEAPGIVTKLLTRDHVKSLVKEGGCVKPRRVTFVLNGVSTPVESEVVHHEYEFVPNKRGHSVRRPGIRAIIDQDAVFGDCDRVEPEGKRVICSVGGFEALSGGFIDCCPSEVLVDSGAIASLVDKRVLRRVGRAGEPLRTYHGSLDSVSGHSIQVRGMIDLPVTLGSVEKTLPFVVVNHLHVDAILGTDTLRAFRGVIDLEEQALILKGSGEVVPLGDSRVEECYGTDIATTVKLAPGRQALVCANVKGQVDPGATVLIEGIAGGDDSLRVARTLCTVLDGQVVVEICNTSTEELVIGKDSQIAVAAVVPETAFQGQQGESLETMTETQVVSAARSAVEGNDVGQKQETMGEHPSDEMKVEFHDPGMDEKQCELFATMLREFSDLFVETSKKPGRTDLLKFKIDTGTHAPIKSQPYRVSKVEGDVMEAELGQYLDLGLIKPCGEVGETFTPWFSGLCRSPSRCCMTGAVSLLNTRLVVLRGCIFPRSTMLHFSNSLCVSEMEE